MSRPTGASVVPLHRAAPAPAAGRPALCDLALSNPGPEHTQEELLEMLGLAGDEFARGIFARSGVSKRRLDVSREWLGRTLQERAADTEARLFEMAVSALDDLCFDPAEIGLVLTASYWSLGGPTLAHRVLDHYGLPAGADKYHLTGIGCASAVPILRLAGQALAARPRGERALVIAAESVSGFLSRAEAGDEKAKTVGSALFADGCAAALIGLGEEDAAGPEIVASAVHQVPGTLDDVRFAVTGADSYMSISRELPVLAETGLRPLVEDFLGRQGLALEDVDHWLVHPGGRGIVDAAQAGLGLADEQVAPSRRVLAEYGNMGTPSSFFVLRSVEEVRAPARGERGLMVAIGPGVTVGLMLLNWRRDG